MPHYLFWDFFFGKEGRFLDGPAIFRCRFYGIGERPVLLNGDYRVGIGQYKAPSKSNTDLKHRCARTFILHSIFARFQSVDFRFAKEFARVFQLLRAERGIGIPRWPASAWRLCRFDDGRSSSCCIEGLERACCKKRAAQTARRSFLSIQSGHPTLSFQAMVHKNVPLQRSADRRGA